MKEVKNLQFPVSIIIIGKTLLESHSVLSWSIIGSKIDSKLFAMHINGFFSRYSMSRVSRIGIYEIIGNIS